MEYTYEIPQNIDRLLIATLKANNHLQLCDLISLVDFSYTDLGFAYYAGVKNPGWNTHAIDCTASVPYTRIDEFRSNMKLIKTMINQILPNDSGLILRNIIIVPQLESIDVELPNSEGEDWEVLYNDITLALSRDEPTLVLDRLHTFAMKYIRLICTKKGIRINDENGDYYALHSLVGMLVKYYKEEKILETRFSEQALKMSLSLFDSFNDVRNNYSFAHDNEIINKAEATLVIRFVSATISFIDRIEKTLL